MPFGIPWTSPLPMPDLWAGMLFTALGLCMGSFANVVIHRLPLMLERRWWSQCADQLRDAQAWQAAWGSGAESTTRPAVLDQAAQAVESAHQAWPPLTLNTPRSHCPHCGHRLSGVELVPVLSWLWLRGQCRVCGQRVSALYPLGEMLVAIVFVACGLRWGWNAQGLLWACAGTVLWIGAVIDARTLLLPDGLTLGLLWLGLAAAAAGGTVPPVQALGGALVGYGALWVVAGLFSWATGREGMGQGDFKLLGAIGAWLGVGALIPVIVIASVSGVAYGAIRHFRRPQPPDDSAYIPFGPFLAVAAVGVSALQGRMWW